ncbi:hypothetical protein VCHA37P193_390036 [Vibrio chagasii]|nr:hypothetical protein VCHA37P193_390036 [Vibrio chagasii]
MSNHTLLGHQTDESISYMRSNMWEIIIALRMLVLPRGLYTRYQLLSGHFSIKEPNLAV